MQEFKFVRAASMHEAIRLGTSARTAQQGADIRFIAGGTTLLDLMKLDVESPRQVIDIRPLGLDSIEAQQDGGIRIGAMVRNSTLAYHPVVRQRYPMLSEAILSGASAQLRNMATTGGNLLQRCRCAYFRSPGFGCNKREPGTGCSAIDGEHRTMAILGGSEQCIATHPSDMAVALLALDALIHIEGPHGKRNVGISDFHLLPSTTPHIENVLQPGELITHVTLPPTAQGVESCYLKLRDRASYEFALASAAVVAVVRDGTLRSVSIALGGVGTKPWRSHQAEAALEGSPATEQNFLKAARILLADAAPLPGNKFKVELATRCIVSALRSITA